MHYVSSFILQKPGTSDRDAPVSGIVRSGHHRNSCANGHTPIIQERPSRVPGVATAWGGVAARSLLTTLWYTEDGRNCWQGVMTDFMDRKLHHVSRNVRRVLQEHSLPTVLFLITDFIGSARRSFERPIAICHDREASFYF
jgi:hypothetical protein